MPLLGFGTWQLKGDDAVTATAAALEAGYRHLDTATIYGNEGEVGRALAECGVTATTSSSPPRCPPELAGQGARDARGSLDLLRTDQVDLWLIHWPGEGRPTSTCGALVDAQRGRSGPEIGVSNFSLEMIDESSRPPESARRSTRSSGAPCCSTPTSSRGTACGPSCWRATARLRGGTLDHRRGRASPSAGRTPAQVIIRWHLQHGIVVIPKSGERRADPLQRRPRRVRAERRGHGGARRPRRLRGLTQAAQPIG